jgi:GNAT superfamily N-acetyltransferase
MEAVRLVRATARNHRRWFERLAHAEGGEVVEGPAGLRWACTPAPHSSTALVLPERLPRARMGEALDALVEHARSRGVRTIGAWWAPSDLPAGWDAALRERGFERGWQPHWMGAALGRLGEPGSVPGVRIEPIGDAAGWPVRAIPYSETAPAVARMVHPRGRPFALQLGASRDGAPVGRGVVHLAAGVAVLYDLGVAESEIRQGIGTALTLQACGWARSRGARHVALNATAAGEYLYRTLGFDSLWRGHTWWLHR